MLGLLSILSFVCLCHFQQMPRGWQHHYLSQIYKGLVCFTLFKGFVEVELMVAKRNDDRVSKEQSAFGRLEGRVLQF